MSQSPKTTYKNLDLVYIEDKDQWQCPDINLADTRLSALKRKIDEHSKSERKIEVKALRPQSSWGGEPELVPVTVTIICEAKGSRDECWIKDAKGERSKVYVSTLVPLSDRKEAEAWFESAKQVKALEKKRDQLLEILPRHSVKSLLEENKAKAST